MSMRIDSAFVERADAVEDGTPRRDGGVGSKRNVGCRLSSQGLGRLLRVVEGRPQRRPGTRSELINRPVQEQDD